MSTGTASLLGARQSLNTIIGSATIRQNTADATRWFEGALLIGADATNTSYQVDTFGGQGRFDIRRANGTQATPTTLTAGTVMGGIGARGYNGTAYSGTSGSLLFTALADWTGSNYSSIATVAIVPPGTTSQVTVATFGDTACLTLPAGTTTMSSLRISHGVAPSAPVDGDIWTTTSGLFVRINGVTKTVTLT